MEIINKEQLSLIERFQNNIEILTSAQYAILERVIKKQYTLFFQDQWSEYIDYGDYNDCHGDYFDAE